MANEKGAKKYAKKSAAVAFNGGPNFGLDKLVLAFGGRANKVKESQVLLETFRKEERASLNHRLLQIERKSSPDQQGSGCGLKVNHCNKKNLQFVAGKIPNSKEEQLQKDLAADGHGGEFLAALKHRSLPAIDRSDLPETSAQEVGWFLKDYTPAVFSDGPEDPPRRWPRRHCELTQYMDTYWSYHPPRPAKFHPKNV